VKAAFQRFLAFFYCLSLLFAPAAALADDVTNNLDTSIDASVEQFKVQPNLNPNVTTGYGFKLKAIPANGDGKQGCNLTGSTSLVVKFVSSNPAVAVAGPNQIAFTSCNTDVNFTVSPGAISGEATISLEEVSNGTQGSFNLAPATFKVITNRTPVVTMTGGPVNLATYQEGSIPRGTCHISDYEDGVNYTEPTQVTRFPHLPGMEIQGCYYTDAAGVGASAGATYYVVNPNTPPTVSVNGVTNGASYAKGSVPTPGCSVTDAQDGNSNPAPSLSAFSGPYASDDLGQRTVNCSYTDNGGLSGSATATFTVYDPTPPVIGYLATPLLPTGLNDWYRDNVILDWQVSDPESPNSLVTTGCVDQLITDDQALTTYSCQATSAGGTSGPVATSIKRDATAPIVQAVLDREPDQNGWYNAPVQVSAFSTSLDLLSGLESCESKTYNGPDSATASVTVTCTDKAGNVGSDTVEFKYDATAPAVNGTLDRTPDHNGWYNAAVTGTATASGAQVSPVTCDTAKAYTGADANPASLTLGCTDEAGNSASTSVAFKIDTAAPQLAPTVSPNPVVLNGSAVATPNASDNLSGIVSQSCDTVVTSTVGAKTVACSASDEAGLTGTANAAYKVIYGWNGFSQPINDTAHQVGVLHSVFKAGSTVPAKFQLKDANGNVVQASGVPTWVGSVKGSPTFSSIDEALYTVAGTPGGTYKWDATAQQYIYNWSTKGIASGFFYRIGVQLDDGQTYYVAIGLK
jgi:hypothetical protein